MKKILGIIILLMAFSTMCYAAYTFDSDVIMFVPMGDSEGNMIPDRVGTYNLLTKGAVPVFSTTNKPPTGWSEGSMTMHNVTGGMALWPLTLNTALAGMSAYTVEWYGYMTPTTAAHFNCPVYRFQVNNVSQFGFPYFYTNNPITVDNAIIGFSFSGVGVNCATLDWDYSTDNAVWVYYDVVWTGSTNGHVKLYKNNTAKEDYSGVNFNNNPFFLNATDYVSMFDDLTNQGRTWQGYIANLIIVGGPDYGNNSFSDKEIFESVDAVSWYALPSLNVHNVPHISITYSEKLYVILFSQYYTSPTFMNMYP